MVQFNRSRIRARSDWLADVPDTNIVLEITNLENWLHDSLCQAATEKLERILYWRRVGVPVFNFFKRKSGLTVPFDEQLRVLADCGISLCKNVAPEALLESATKLSTI